MLFSAVRPGQIFPSSHETILRHATKTTYITMPVFTLVETGFFMPLIRLDEQYKAYYNIVEWQLNAHVRR